MPAIAFSHLQIDRELKSVVSRLGGRYPDQPSAAMADVPLPVYGLAFSSFLKTLDVKLSAGYAELTATLVATIHRLGRPAEIIREYRVETIDPIRIVFDYDAISRELYWRQDGAGFPKVTPSWGTDADAVLANTTLPDPQKDSYLAEVESPIIWSTRNTFVELLIASLPRYPLGEMAPWLSLLEPLRFDFGGDHVIVTASRAKVAAGGCSPSTMIVEPDPNFPYGETIPAPSFSARHVDIAVYLPKTRFIDFVSGNLEPAVLVAARGGGVVKWSVSGAFGLKTLTADIKTGIIYPSGLTVEGIIGISTEIDFIGVARAWVDGPCGTKIGLASASVLGSGEFAADIRLEANIHAGYITGDLKVAKSELIDVDFDVGVPWPLDAISGELLDYVAQKEIRKLTNRVVQLGRWDFMGIPLSYLDSLSTNRALPIMEGLKGVGAYMGIVQSEG
ncbi:hypothetical protein ABI_39950 [Asticcacaulis biprosthecium C19]|uniref:Uncharacterized protein n=2 Tax=Asticcacaulis biprosthecium TaxID=76891 RepID=F4QS58_9CAUL|nr:hypothetical protein ABI_39950 [Asticcacaulis biprosthecium C19]